MPETPLCRPDGRVQRGQVHVVEPVAGQCRAAGSRHRNAIAAGLDQPGLGCAPYAVDLDGQEHAVDLHDLEAVSVKDTNHIRIFHEAARLADFDLIDMPGISDPNMAADVWQR